MKYFSKLKLNAKGFAHVELVMIVATITVIGGIGSYVMLKRSHADPLSSAAICGSGYSYVADNNIYATINGSEKVLGKAQIFRKQISSTQVQFCGLTNSSTYTDGVAKTMSITMSKRKPGGAWSSVGSNSGTFSRYAGPVRTAQISTSYCVSVTGKIVWKGVAHTATAASSWACQ
jgi:hypothetical protein